MTEVTFHNQFWGAPEDSAVPHPRKLSITPSVIKKVRQGHRYPVRKFDLKKKTMVGWVFSLKFTWNYCVPQVQSSQVFKRLLGFKDSSYLFSCRVGSKQSEVLLLATHNMHFGCILRHLPGLESNQERRNQTSIWSIAFWSLLNQSFLLSFSTLSLFPLPYSNFIHKAQRINYFFSYNLEKII